MYPSNTRLVLLVLNRLGCLHVSFLGLRGAACFGCGSFVRGLLLCLVVMVCSDVVTNFGAPVIGYSSSVRSESRHIR